MMSEAFAGKPLEQYPSSVKHSLIPQVSEKDKEILRLRAENEKLRAATLEDAANVADVKARTVGNGRDEYSLACRHIARELRAAAAALKETE